MLLWRPDCFSEIWEAESPSGFPGGCLSIARALELHVSALFSQAHLFYGEHHSTSRFSYLETNISVCSLELTQPTVVYRVHVIIPLHYLRQTDRQKIVQQHFHQLVPTLSCSNVKQSFAGGAAARWWRSKLFGESQPRLHHSSPSSVRDSNIKICFLPRADLFFIPIEVT